MENKIPKRARNLTGFIHKPISRIALDPSMKI